MSLAAVGACCFAHGKSRGMSLAVLEPVASRMGSLVGILSWDFFGCDGACCFAHGKSCCWRCRLIDSLCCHRGTPLLLLVASCGAVTSVVGFDTALALVALVVLLIARQSLLLPLRGRCFDDRIDDLIVSSWQLVSCSGSCCRGRSVVSFLPPLLASLLCWDFVVGCRGNVASDDELPPFGVYFKNSISQLLHVRLGRNLGITQSSSRTAGYYLDIPCYPQYWWRNNRVGGYRVPV